VAAANEPAQLANARKAITGRGVQRPTVQRGRDGARERALAKAPVDKLINLIQLAWLVSAHSEDNFVIECSFECKLAVYYFCCRESTNTLHSQTHSLLQFHAV